MDTTLEFWAIALVRSFYSPSEAHGCTLTYRHCLTEAEGQVVETMSTFLFFIGSAASYSWCLGRWIHHLAPYNNVDHCTIVIEEGMICEIIQVITQPKRKRGGTAPNGETGLLLLPVPVRTGNSTFH